ncbi:MAG: hypothetical protein ACLPGW_19535 [Roseiarcus sp.]
MNAILKYVTGNVVRHIAGQVAMAAAVGAVTYVAKVDYSSLGIYAPLAQMAAATAVSIVNEAIGAAPKAS